MALGIVNHLSLAVSDFRRSHDFYKPIMSFLGYIIAEQGNDWVIWRRQNGIGDLILFQSPANLVSDHHVREAPGFHHLAFNAETRSQVDDFFQNILLKYRMKVLDSPCDCPEYSRGYYAVFFEDPDGMKLELAYTPNQ
jgi:glyoxylase I family protein